MKRDRALDAVIGVAVAFVVLGPLLVGSGYWLFGDMVFVPRQPWKDAWLGLDGSLPRAVPMDAIVSLLTQVVPGSWVQKTFLTGAFVLGALGVGLLAADHAWYARSAGIMVYLWNPWVHERLLIGQWAILAGYLALPWVALAARRLRRDGPVAGWAPAAVALSVSALCSPSSGVMAVFVLAVLGLTRSWRAWATVVGLGLLANLTWLVPSLVALPVLDDDAVTTEGVFDLFAARAESSAGVLPSLVSMGGTWKTSILAEERTSSALVLLSCLLTAAALVGLRRLVRPHEVRRLLALAGLALLLAALPSTLTGGAGAEAWEWLGQRAPTIALLRDSHRFLAPAGLVLAVGLVGAATWAREQVAPGREAMWAVVGLAVVAPVVLLPSLAWGGGELERSTYPFGWQEAADTVASHPAATTVVLPWEGSYRRFDFTGGRAVLDPAPRLLPGEVLVDDRTFVDGVVVGSEDPRVGAVSTALAAGDPGRVADALRVLGVRWVLVEPDAAAPAAALPNAVTTHVWNDVALLDLGVEPDARTRAAAVHEGQVALVIAGHAGALLLLVGGLVWILRMGVTAITRL